MYYTKKKIWLFGSLMWIGGFLFLLSTIVADKYPSTWSIAAFAASSIWLGTFGLLYSSPLKNVSLDSSSILP